MGCKTSILAHKRERNSYLNYLDEKKKTLSLTTWNELEIDYSHFSNSKELLGIGGFGVVKLVEKLSGPDKGKLYALKSLSKSAILQRSNGISSAIIELTALTMIKDYPFICNVNYAFYDSKFLYLVLDLSTCGDLRMNIRDTKNNRFSESIAIFFITQIFLALEYCHNLNILHRGSFLCINNVGSDSYFIFIFVCIRCKTRKYFSKFKWLCKTHRFWFIKNFNRYRRLLCN